MKKILLTAIALASSLTFFGQNTFPETGNVGIGTIEPQHPLDIKLFGTNVKTYSHGLETTVNTTGGWARSIRFRNENDDKTVVFGGVSGRAYINTGFDVDSDPTGYRNAKLTILENGNVGIGTTEPQHKLDMSLSSATRLKTYNYGLETTVNTTGGWARSIRFRNENDDKTVVFGGVSGRAYISTGFDVDSDPTGYRNAKLTILENGKVGIGTTNPDAPLTVKGKIHCEEVQVDLQVPADYVFEKYYTGASELKEEYTMPTLEEVEAYTKENHHLPSIPSAKTIQEEGLHLKEMTNLLLQKVEELTLYTIEQQKEINELKQLVKN